MLLLVTGKGPNPKEAEAAREIMREYVRTQHDGNVSAAARALGLSQPTVREVLLGERAPGFKTLDALSAAIGLTREQILLGAKPSESRIEKPDRYPHRATAIKATESDGFDPEAIAEVKAINNRGDLDPPVWWWVNELRDAHARILAERADPSLKIFRSRRSEQITEEHLELSDEHAKAAEQRLLERKRAK